MVSLCCSIKCYRKRKLIRNVDGQTDTKKEVANTTSAKKKEKM